MGGVEIGATILHLKSFLAIVNFFIQPICLPETIVSQT